MLDKIRNDLRLAADYQPFSWISHWTVASQGPALVLSIVAITLAFSPMIVMAAYTFLTVALAVYFHNREGKDEVRHKYVLMDWDTAVGEITPHMDRTFDLFGPVTTAINAVSMMTLAWFPWAAFGLAAVCWAYLIREIPRSARKQEAWEEQHGSPAHVKAVE